MGSICLPLPIFLRKHSEQPCSLPLAEPAWGIEMYMAFQPIRFIPVRYCYPTACALTARFHLYLSIAEQEILSLWPSLSTLAGSPSVRWYGALRCPDFPHFFQLPEKTAIEQLVAGSKLRFFQRRSEWLFKTVPYLHFLFWNFVVIFQQTIGSKKCTYFFESYYKKF